MPSTTCCAKSHFWGNANDGNEKGLNLFIVVNELKNLTAADLGFLTVCQDTLLSQG